jgi:hypothetical protein
MMTKKEFWKCIAAYMLCKDCPVRAICFTMSITESLFCSEKLMMIYEGLKEREDDEDD